MWIISYNDEVLGRGEQGIVAVLSNFYGSGDRAV